MRLENIDPSILELSFSESVKDMCLMEQDEQLLNFINDNIDSEELLNEKFYSSLIPYFEYNILLFTNLFTDTDILSEADLKEKVKYYSSLLKEKMNPKVLLNAAKSGVKKALVTAKSNVGKAITSGLVKAKRAVGGEIVKRLNYASQNTANMAKTVQKHIQ